MSESSFNSIVARNFARVVGAQGDTLERLGSGLRINKVSDDAAGLALATSLQSKARVYSQAQKNVTDGTSFLNVADAAGEALQDIVERQKSLAAMATNSGITTEQRTLLDAEFQALATQYNSIITETEYNGRKIFNSSQLQVQAGYGTAESIGVNLASSSYHQNTGVYNISTSSTGLQGTGDSATSAFYAQSADGRYVVFNSLSSDLVSGDSNGVSDIFWKDTVTGEIRLISKSTAGIASNGGSAGANVSDDGRYVVYQSSATTLSAADTNGVADIYMTDVFTGTTTLISSTSAGVVGNASSTVGRITGDGQYVIFESTASNLVAGDTNGASDIFMKNIATGETTRVSLTDGDAEATGSSTGGYVSDDGRYVTFISTASNLVAGDSNGFTDAFVRDTVLGTTTRVSVSTAGTEANAATEQVTVSSDGRYMLFYTIASNMVAGDANGVRDVFLRDTATGITELISYTDSEGQGNSSSYFGTISDDGRFVSFISQATNLTSATDVNGASNDVFVRDRTLGTTTWIGAGGNGTTQGASISNDGRYVVVTTAATNLWPGDSNGAQDVLQYMRNGASSSTTSGYHLGGMYGMYLTSLGGATAAQNALELFGDEVSLYRGVVGAGLSRLESAEMTASVRAENYRAAADTIMNADVASDVADAAKQSILINTGAAVMAQANLQPGVVLRLLMED